MSCFTILMNQNKILTITNNIRLHQHENLVDKVCFVTPIYYGEIKLNEFSCVLEWLDPTNVAHVDVLMVEDEPYKENYQRYFLPVTSPLNRYTGEVECKLVFTKVDYETNTRYKLETSTITIPIETIKDYYAVIPDESFDAINDKIDALQSLVDQVNASAEIYDKIKADNIAFNDDGDVQLKSNDTFIGNAISVAVPGTEDDMDMIKDGVISIDDFYTDVLI